METCESPFKQRRRIPLIFPLRFHKFKTRILFFFLGLMGLVLAGVFMAVNTANLKSTRLQIGNNLKIAEKVFNRLIEIRSHQLARSVYYLSSDFAFKTAVSTNDHATILSALENFSLRIKADAMMLVSPDHILMANTLRPEAKGGKFFLSSLIEAAEEKGEAFSMVFIEGQTHQMVVAPILAPEPIAWLCVSFAIDEAMLKELKYLTNSNISLFRIKAGKTEGIASTLPTNLSRELAALVEKTGMSEGNNGNSPRTLSGVEFVTLSTIIFRDENSTVMAVLQRSLEDELEPFYRLRKVLMLLSVCGFIVTIIGGILTSRSVTKPVLTLVMGVREIGKGNYGHVVSVSQQDEIGELARSFNQMTSGLAEKEKVRNLLGKMISPEVAHELLSKEVTLGGEEKYMTVFFSDVAGFTSISETLEPKDLVELLNEYLSEMANIINQTGGVIDKFIGDAIVAFWGAPLPKENHAELAVRAALLMRKKLTEMRAVWRGQDRDEIHARIGINTGKMVVGNMGSRDRMDYTIMGDAVNLGARLEGANKYYGTDIIISEFTHAHLNGKFLCRELDFVRVQGKKTAICIYEVVCEREEANDGQFSLIRRFDEALQAFRLLELDKSMELFRNCDSLGNGSDGPSKLYIRRIENLILNPPPENWDRIYDLAK